MFTLFVLKSDQQCKMSNLIFLYDKNSWSISLFANIKRAVTRSLDVVPIQLRIDRLGRR